MTGAMRYVQSAAALALGAWLLGACGGALTDNGGDCEHDGASYAHGESFPAGDNCNTCSCEDGKVACTRADCSVACVHEGNHYDVGARFAASDGCNTCSCEQAGVVSCSELTCDRCQKLTQSYETAINAAKACDPQASGQCSQLITEGLACSCEAFANPDNATAIVTVQAAQEHYASFACSGNVACGACAEATSGYCSAEGRCETRSDAPGGAGCMVAGVVYESGASGIDDPFSCNTCNCLDGQLACTKIGCPEDCPPNRVAGTQCAECGPADGCEVVEHACLLVCNGDDTCDDGACIDGVCRMLCG